MDGLGSNCHHAPVTTKLVAVLTVTMVSKHKSKGGGGQIHIAHTTVTLAYVAGGLLHVKT